MTHKLKFWMAILIAAAAYLIIAVIIPAYDCMIEGGTPLPGFGYTVCYRGATEP